MVRLILVEDRGDIVLHMTGGEQHAGHRQNMIDALGGQLVEAGADDRRREFQKSILHRIVREAFG